MQKSPKPARLVMFALVPAAVVVAWAAMGCSAKSDFWDRSGGATTYTTMPHQSMPRGSRPSYGMREAPRQAPPPGWGIPEDAARRGARRSVAQAPSANAGDEEAQVLAQVNAIRARRGLPALTYNPNLHQAAREHSLEQKRHNYMGHGSPDPRRRTLAQRMKLAGYSGRAFGEVVAKGFRSTSGVVQGWMNSPSHRDILLDRELTEAAFSRVGTYWTGNFGRPFAPGESQRGRWHRVPVGMVHDTPAAPGMMPAHTPTHSAPTPVYRPVPSWPAPVQRHVAYTSSPTPYTSVRRPAFARAPADFYRSDWSTQRGWGSAKPYSTVKNADHSGSGTDVGWVPTSVTPEWGGSAKPFRASGSSSDWGDSVPYRAAHNSRSSFGGSFGSAPYSPAPAPVMRAPVLQPAPQLVEIVQPAPPPVIRKKRSWRRCSPSPVPPECKT